ncbi:hypothetical protein C7212DRAFT_339748 [Tuber magnatum]|uniref:Uncharacterized protein n=1 Tax=Tuber magnatum TaxID=42249 RepID=A0A317SB19_9PEZI|nr:hypothetical protein C7212DRAFT_339748 [Tuber magnatum]
MVSGAPSSVLLQDTFIYRPPKEANASKRKQYEHPVPPNKPQPQSPKKGIPDNPMAIRTDDIHPLTIQNCVY